MNKFIGVVLIVVVVVGVVLFGNAKKEESVQTSSASLPIPIAKAAADPISVMDSPEGSKILTVESGSVYVSPKDIPIRQLIYKKSLSDSELLEIPFNTWSPDTKYFFLKDTDGSEPEYLVFRSSGVPFPNETVFLSVRDLFMQKVQRYVIEDVTGWADLTLLIVNTENVDTGAKVSFWFDVPSQSFIQLGTYFK